jgi:hypothetical protein
MPKGMPGARVGFLAARLDWHDDKPPTAESIAGAGIREQGLKHVLAVTSAGGAILGNRSLSSDRLQPELFVHKDVIMQGFKRPLRAWKPGDMNAIQALSWWGYGVILDLAEKQWANS